MGDENTVLSESDVRHLLRRTGFGPTPKELKKADLTGANRGQAADFVLAQKRKAFKASGNEDSKVHNKWMKWLIKGKTPLQSKIVLFWHDHFSTTASDVDEPELMGKQLTTHYVYSLGNFKDYVKAINLDPAMMIFLDTVKNKDSVPNENYARELCELFTLGVTDLLGVPNYAQEDVVQIARAFTGWRLNSKGVPYLKTNHHDFDEEWGGDRGPKVLFDNAHGFPEGGVSFTVGGEGENEIDEVVEILFQHLDSEGKNTVARRTAYRLLEFFAYAEPELAVVDDVVSESSFDTVWDLEALCRAIFVHDAFYETASPVPFDMSTKKSVKWPVDYMVSTLRLLRMKPKGKDLEVPGGSYKTMIEHGRSMGQVIGDPPSVFGWDWEGGWISSSTMLARFEFARDIVNARASGRFKPEKLIDASLTDAGAIVDAVTDLLGVTDQYTTADRDAFIDYLEEGEPGKVIDLDDFNTRNVKLHGLFALVITSPQYQVQ